MKDHIIYWLKRTMPDADDEAIRKSANAIMKDIAIPVYWTAQDIKDNWENYAPEGEECTPWRVKQVLGKINNVDLHNDDWHLVSKAINEVVKEG